MRCVEPEGNALPLKPARSFRPCVRTPMSGDVWWTVRIDNTSKAAITIVAVDVAAFDANGIEVADVCRQATSAGPIDEVVLRPIGAAWPRLSEDGSRQLVASGWRRTLPPNQHTAMAYITTDPQYGLGVTVDYEDEADCQWRRTDIGQPKRLDSESDSQPN